jgi:DNA-binding CsgD family transcriptional regulator
MNPSATTPPFDAPVVCPVLVGRAPALARLERLVEQASAGRGATCVLAGEAGVGKSRFVAEVIGRAGPRGFAVLEGHCFEPDRAVPYAPVIDLLRGLAADRNVERIAGTFGQVAPDLAALSPDLAELVPNLGTDQPVARPIVDPGQERRRLFEALTRLLVGLAATGPLLVIVEDLHWADDTSLGFLLHLSRRVPASAILLLLTYRDDEPHQGLVHFLAGLDRERLATEVSMARLSLADVETMVMAMLASPATAPGDLPRVLHELTEGNPFFIEEVLRSLIAAGDLARAGGTWEHAPVAHWRVPRSVQDAVQRRTERLSAAAARVLRLAAVAGHRFDFALLQALTGLGDEQLLDLVKELIAAQLVAETSSDRFAFRHALTRQAVYGRMLATERTRLHGSIAETVVRLYGGEPDTRISELAYHTYEAGDWPRAMAYARRAGERAQALGAPREAAEQLTRALDAAGQLGVAAPVELRRARGLAFETLGEFERARADLAAALEGARADHDARAEWRALLDLGAFWAGHDYARAGEQLQQALVLARAIDDPGSLAHTLNRLGNWLANTGDPAQGVRAHREALALFEAVGDRSGVAATLDLLGMATVFSGDFVAAVGHLDRAVELFRGLGDQRGLASCLAARGPFAAAPSLGETTYAALWSPVDCLRDADEAVELMRAIDWPAGRAFVCVGAGPTCGEFGEFGAAFAWSRECLRIATEIGHEQWRAAAHSALGNLHVHLLMPDPAIEHLETALAVARRLGSAWWTSMGAVGLTLAHLLKADVRAAEAALAAAHAVDRPSTLAERRLAWARGEAALRRGDAAAALAIADGLLASTPGGPREQPIPALLKLRGEALAAVGRLDEATDALGGAERAAVARGLRPLLWQVHRSLGRVHARAKRAARAREEFVAAREMVAALATTIPDDAQREHFVAAALATLPPERPASPLRAARQAYGGLTRREREVAGLIARGESNRAIAAALFVSEGTVATHVSSILAKLEFSSRAQIAVWAAERGLAGQA